MDIWSYTTYLDLGMSSGMRTLSVQYASNRARDSLVRITVFGLDVRGGS